MSLSKYHRNYQNRSDEQIKRRMAVKRIEFQHIFKRLDWKPTSDPVRVAIFGCGDRRFVSGHRSLLSELLDSTIELKTFDITTEHLAGEQVIIEHDLTQPLPSGPFDLIVAHVLLKFIDQAKQVSVLVNAHEALVEGGVAVFVQGKQELEFEDRVENYSADHAYKYEQGDLTPVRIDQITAKLEELGIGFEQWDEEIEGVEDVAIYAHYLVLKK